VPHALANTSVAATKAALKKKHALCLASWPAWDPNVRSCISYSPMSRTKRNSSSSAFTRRQLWLVWQGIMMLFTSLSYHVGIHHK